MRRFIITSLLALALIVGATGAASSAYAQTVGSPENPDPGLPATENGSAYTQAAIDATNAASQGGIDAAGKAAAQSAAAKTSTDPSGKIADGYNSVMQWIMLLFAWLVGVAALTLDTAVFYTVVTMGDYVHKIAAIGVAWRILRDVGNIMLIFGFLAIGISIILNTERLGWGRKMLPMLLVAAIFLNFSLFFTEAIIDTGNLFATQFYKQINGGNMPTAAFTASATVKNEGISNKLMAQLGLQSLYNVNDGKVNKQIFEGSNPSVIGFLGILLFIVTAFVMFSLAFILIARFVMLIFLIILAPVGFAGLAVPQLAKKAGQWWDKLFEQTITAPVLLLLLYVALAVITDAQFLTGFKPTGGTWLGYINNTDLSGFGGVLLSFLVAMGLLLAVVISAKSLSAFGADKASSYAGKLTFGATAWGMRTTAGWGANRAAKYLRSARVSRIPIAGTGFIKGLDKVAKGSFDVRGATAFGGLKAMNIDAGTAQKGGYKEDLKVRTESRVKYASELKGKDFKDLSAAEQFTLAEHQKELSRLEKVKKEARTVDDLKNANADIKAKEKEIETFNLENGTEAGNKIKYARVLTGERFGFEPDKGFGKVFNFFNPAANTDAAKKIKEEAKKSKDDKDLESLKKMLKKAEGDDTPTPTPAAPSGGAPAPAAGGHA